MLGPLTCFKSPFVTINHSLDVYLSFSIRSLPAQDTTTDQDAVMQRNAVVIRAQNLSIRFYALETKLLLWSAIYNIVTYCWLDTGFGLLIRLTGHVYNINIV
jgi:hypothetical protein